MKKIVKSLLILSVIMAVMAVFAISACAADGAGDGIDWKFNESTGFLELNGVGTMLDFGSAEDAPWFSVRNKIVTIAFYGNITNVGSNAFRNCSVEYLYLSDTVKTIGASAFEGCTNLTSISLPKVTAVGDFAFSGCDHVASIEATSLVTVGNNAFAYNCLAKTISIGSNVKSIGNYAFYRCSSVTAVDIPSATKTLGDYAFAYCSVLKTVNIASGLETIGRNAFYFCPAMTAIALPDTVKSVGESAFEGCRFLASLSLGSGVTEIGANAFYKCMKLVTVTGGTALETVGKRAFFATGYYNDSVNWVEGVLYVGNCAVAGNYSGPVAVTVKSGTSSIADGAFAGNQVLLNIALPGSVEKIGDYAFSNCTSLLIAYYGGSSTDWTSKVDIGEGNAVLNTVKLIFGSYSRAGDLNDDKIINAKDCVLLAQYIARWNVILNLVSADCNGDGTINAVDCVLLAQYIAGWDVELKNPGGTGGPGGDVDIPSDGIFGPNGGDVEIPSEDLLA